MYNSRKPFRAPHPCAMCKGGTLSIMARKYFSIEKVSTMRSRLDGHPAFTRYHRLEFPAPLRPQRITPNYVLEMRRRSRRVRHGNGNVPVDAAQSIRLRIFPARIPILKRSKFPWSFLLDRAQKFFNAPSIPRAENGRSDERITVPRKFRPANRASAQPFPDEFPRLRIRGPIARRARCARARFPPQQPVQNSHNPSPSTVSDSLRPKPSLASAALAH
jgi:hypothetical protein